MSSPSDPRPSSGRAQVSQDFDMHCSCLSPAAHSRKDYPTPSKPSIDMDAPNHASLSPISKRSRASQESVNRNSRAIEQLTEDELQDLRAVQRTFVRISVHVLRQRILCVGRHLLRAMLARLPSTSCQQYRHAVLGYVAGRAPRNFWPAC